ncbi:MAG: hypothetical protein WAX69_21390 [Victivallales bacterium]
MFRRFLKKKLFENYTLNLSRDEIIRRSRILVVDDEKPQVIQDMQASGFSVDYLSDITKDNVFKVDKNIYDLILLDFGGVGKGFGNDQGLSLLKHIKRVNPSTIVIAYTSKSLSSEQSDFFRMSDSVLLKDAGIQESLEKIEETLRIAHSFENTWNAILKITEIKAGSEEDYKLQHELISSYGNQKKMAKTSETISDYTKSVSKELTVSLITKTFELLALATIA